MAGRKRKAVAEASETPSRRQRRVTKTRVTYQESHSSKSDAESSDEFQEDASEVERPQSEDEDEFEEAAEEDSEAPEEDGSDDEYEKKLKKEGWKKKKGKDGKVEMVMDVPTAKDAGDTPYEDERIHPNTMEFLKDLKKNNRREWLKFHDAVFRYVSPTILHPLSVS